MKRSEPKWKRELASKMLKQEATWKALTKVNEPVNAEFIHDLDVNSMYGFQMLHEDFMKQYLGTFDNETI